MHNRARGEGKHFANSVTKCNLSTFLISKSAYCVDRGENDGLKMENFQKNWNFTFSKLDCKEILKMHFEPVEGNFRPKS